MQTQKKYTAKQTFDAAIYAAKLVLQLKPKLFAAGFADEAFNRTIPFVEAFLAAKIITLLPALTSTSLRANGFRSILMTLGLLVFVRLLQQVENSLYSFYQSKQEIGLNASIGRKLTEKFAALPYARYEEKEVMDQYDLATHYSNILSTFVLFRLRSAAGAVYAVVLAAVAFAQFSLVLTAIIAVAAIPQLLLEFRVNREQRKSWRETTTNRRKALSFEALFSPQSIKDSRLFGLVQYALDKAFHYGKAAQEEQVNIDSKAEKYRLALRLLDAVVEVGALAYVVRLIYLGAQPIGQFVFAQQILQRFSSSLGEVMYVVQDLDEYLSGAVEFHDFMDLPSQPAGTTDFDAGLGIRLQDVSFTYPGAAKPSLRNISLSIPAGKTIALVGENGAGKTTLVKLLMKLYVPSGGQALVGGISLAELDENAWHERLGVLFQDFSSFTDFTIRENVTFGRLDRTDDDKAIGHALKQAGAYEFVHSLPKGVDTYLGKYMDEENGTMLSGGQLQRLAIARVLFRDPQILILDEPTSAVDAKAEYDIFRELEKARRGNTKTTILISHRFSTVRKADYIYVLSKGQLAEQGTHGELLALDGHYAALFNAQAEGYR